MTPPPTPEKLMGPKNMAARSRGRKGEYASQLGEKRSFAGNSCEPIVLALKIEKGEETPALREPSTKTEELGDWPEWGRGKFWRRRIAL